MRVYRDVLILDTPFCNRKLVISSDSLASIGNMPEDKVKVDPYLVGKYSARVVLFEVLSVGAEPYAIINNLSIGTKNSERIIEGIKDEAQIPVFGSTEDNFPTKQTFLSIFCLGFADELRVGRSVEDDLVVAIGIPCVGVEVIENEQKLPDMQTINKLLQLDVHDIVPTGSKGVVHEIKVLESETGLRFEKTNKSFPYEKSCGPSSVLLVTLSKSSLRNLEILNKPISVLGRLKR